MRRFLPLAALGAAAFAGLLLTATPFALASRNSSGTYSLPAGNPIVTGTTISSSNENSFRSDVGTEITDSFSRSGKGPMLAALQAYVGTAAAPGITWSGDTDLGFYRAGANDMRAVVGSSTEAERWTSSGITASLPATFAPSSGVALTVTGVSATTALSATSISATAISGTAGTSGVGVAGTGAGASAGVSGTGGGSSGSGVLGTGGASNGVGVTGAGTGSGAGVAGTGGATGVGGAFTGGSGGAIGLTGTGTGASAGGSFANGTAATGGTRRDALTLTNGDLNLSGVANPTSTTAVTNRLTPKNMVKAWGFLSTTSSASVTVNDGFNLTSCSASTTTVSCTLASAMSGTNNVVLVTASTNAAPRIYQTISGSTTNIQITAYNSTTGAVINPQTVTETFGFVVFGAQ